MNEPKLTMLALSFMLKQFSQQPLSLEHATTLQQEVQGLLKEIEPENTQTAYLMKGFLQRFEQLLERKRKLAEFEQKHTEIMQEIEEKAEAMRQKKQPDKT